MSLMLSVRKDTTHYPFKEYSDITNIFPNIKLTTKNCDE